MYLPPLWPHAGSACCRVSFPSFSDFVPSWFAVDQWPPLLLAAPMLAGIPSVASDVSESYSRCASAPCSDLEPSAQLYFRGRYPVLPLSAAVYVSVPSGSTIRGPPIALPLLPSAPFVLVARAVGFCPCPFSLGPTSVAVLPPWFFPPQGLLGHSGGVGALWRLNSSAHTVPPPQGFPLLRRPRSPPPRPPLQGTRGPLRRPRGPRLRLALLGFCHPYFLPASFFHSLRRLCPMAAPRSLLLAAAEGAFLVYLPSALAPPLYCSRAAVLRAPWQRCQNFSSLL